LRTVGLDRAVGAGALRDDDDVGALRDAVVAVRVVVGAAHWRVCGRDVRAVARCEQQRPPVRETAAQACL